SSEDGMTSTTYTEWNLPLPAEIDPNSRIARTIKSYRDQWAAAQTSTVSLRDAATKRYDTFDLHNTEARKIATLRHQRVAEFSAARFEIVSRIKNARSEVRADIEHERKLIDGTYQATIAPLRVWNIVKRARAKARHVRQLAGYRARLAIYPVTIRTMRLKPIHRAALRAEASHYLITDGILQQAQKAHMREAWFGPVRPLSPSPTPLGATNG
ncbi:MAG: hypothetical protein ACJ8AW_20140, partial [Rhodopila sp.]